MQNEPNRFHPAAAPEEDPLQKVIIEFSVYRGSNISLTMKHWPEIPNPDVANKAEKVAELIKTLKPEQKLCIDVAHTVMNSIEKMLNEIFGAGNGEQGTNDPASDSACPQAPQG